MDTELKTLIANAVRDTSPEENVYLALKDKCYPAPPIVLSIGKAASSQAKGAWRALGGNMKKGIIITKYGHGNPAPPGFLCMEAGHPVPDENTLKATGTALRETENLTQADTVIFLISGGGSSLFEQPLVSLPRLAELTEMMLKKGCDIEQINSVRKHLSAVKGGRFALHCRPAKVENYLLSDVQGDDPATIASGPAAADTFPADFALRTAEEFHLPITPEERRLLQTPLPARLDNVSHRFTGNIRLLLQSAEKTLKSFGYQTVILREFLTGEARVQAEIFAEFLREKQRENPGKRLAFLMGGETTVTVKGNGKGGRNQEFALAAALALEGSRGIRIAAFGSDGTDGVTDNAGGFADGKTAEQIRKAGLPPRLLLQNNDSAAALAAADALIITGPTGTNVNDLYIGLLS